MSILNEYQREDKFTKSLEFEFDKLIEINKEKIESLLDTTDIILASDDDVDKKSWKSIYKKIDFKQEKKLIFKFSNLVSQNHGRYLIILSRFTKEHLKFPKAVTFTVKTQISYIKSVIKRLDIDYFENADNDYDKFIFKFKDLAINLLDELIDKIKTDYSEYLQDIDLNSHSSNDIIDDGIGFNTSTSIMVLINELGIINFLKDSINDSSNAKLGIILSKITSLNNDTITRNLIDMNKGQKNDPYKNSSNILKAESFMKLHNIKKRE